MACLWLVPLVISVLGLVCSCEYINVTVSGENTSWENVNQMSGCKVAGLNRTGKLDPTDIRVLNHMKPLDAWIAAQVVLSPWINITGCFYRDSSSFTGGVDISNERSPVETCFDKCSSEEFALTATRCYCLQGVTSIRRIPCLGHACGSRNNSLCGHNNTCMCHYKQLSTDLDVNMTGNCMTILNTSGEFTYRAQNCSFGHTFVCTYINQSGIAVYGTNSIRSWTNALSGCDHNNQLLFGLDTNNIPTHTHKFDSLLMYWIGMFRFQHFHWGKSQQCVSVNIFPSDTKPPELQLRNCGTTLPVLCEQSESNKKTPSPAHISSDLPSVSTTDTISDGGDTGSSSAVLLPPVLGSAAGLVIIMLVTSVVCYIKRRKRQKHTESRHGKEVAIDAHSHRYIDIEAHDNPPYSELSIRKSDQTQVQDDYTYNHLHCADFDSERIDNLYNHTTDFRSEYDSFEKFSHDKYDQTQSEYDHIKANAKLSSLTDNENYDIMEELRNGKGSVANDDTYDHM